MNKFYKDKESITAWLDKYKIKNYILIPDKKYGFKVNVAGDVRVSAKLKTIPIKFNNIEGLFDCGGNLLTSLEFAPKIVNAAFACQYNLLQSLEHCPSEVGASFLCTNNQIRSLEYLPQKVNGNFYCDGNPLLGSFQKVKDFNIIKEENLRLQSLKELNQKLSIELVDNNKSLKMKL